MKLAMIILDALGPDGMRALELKNIERLYNRYGDVLTVSGIPHTAPQNAQIFSGIALEDAKRFWIRYRDTSTITKRIDPAAAFSRDDGEVVSDKVRLWTRNDFEAPFIWDRVAADGRDAIAYHIPIILPPYNYGCTPPATDTWFPDTMERCAGHVREFVERSVQYLNRSPDFYATSCQYPDKLWHGMGGDFEGDVGLTDRVNGPHPLAQKFVEQEAAYLDKTVPQLVTEAEKNDMEWVVMGDHGAPQPGSLPIQDIDGSPFVLPRHGKQAVIISSIDDPPQFTDELFPWFCDVLDIDPASHVPTHTEKEEEGMEQTVVERLGNLGYL